VEKGKDLFFRWLESEGRSIHGRDVRVVFRDDGYNPTQAAAVCKEMVEDEDVFMLVGVTGENQIQTCARYADSVGVPYVSPGTITEGLEELDTHFMTSASWPRQGALLGRFFVKRLDAKSAPNAVIYRNTSSLSKTVDRFSNVLSRKGALLYKKATSCCPGASDASLIIEELKLREVENVFVLALPPFFMQLLGAAENADYSPTWSGIGRTMTHDGIAQAGCQAGPLDGARFFSPFPAFADRNDYDRKFSRAMNEFYPRENGGDDYMWFDWSQGKYIAKMLRLAGRDLTRKGFVRAVERATIKNGIGPALPFSPEDHRPARQVHVLRADCDTKRWTTARAFVSRFR
jgi:ABC-type branched-subunit amino acid transport system substrate-binding protein